MPGKCRPSRGWLWKGPFHEPGRWKDDFQVTLERGFLRALVVGLFAKVISGLFPEEPAAIKRSYYALARLLNWNFIA